MVLRKLENGELIQINLAHNEEGIVWATVYGVGFELSDPADVAEAKELAYLYADEVVVLEFEPRVGRPRCDLCGMRPAEVVYRNQKLCAECAMNLLAGR